eukprot:2447726-Rhodomonas_salina.2
MSERGKRCLVKRGFGVEEEERGHEGVGVAVRAAVEDEHPPRPAPPRLAPEPLRAALHALPRVRSVQVVAQPASLSPSLLLALSLSLSLVCLSRAEPHALAPA